jgi:dihydroorotate dehydrogenase electron transfer subunit
VTDLLPEALDEAPTGNPVQIYACGPEPMLDAVTRIARARGVPAQLSLDRRMGCGLGACGACVCKVASPKAPDGWDYIRICREGPVVDAARLVP